MAVRPARLAVLVPTKLKQTSWMAVMESALAAQASFWGGSGNLVFPIEDFADDDVFWGLADVFDPDAFVAYSPTIEERAEIAPAVHKKDIEKQRRSLERKHGKEFANDAIADLMKQRFLSVQPADADFAKLIDRIAPFHHERSPSHHLDSYDGVSEQAWPFTDVRRFNDLPRRLRNPVAPAGVARKLLLTAAAGRIGASFRHQLAERGVEVADENLERWRWSGAAVDRRRERQQDNPWALSDLGLGRYSRGFIDLPAALVVGNTAWDFALFYALKHMSGMAWWLPSSLMRDPVYMHTLGSALEYEPTAEGREVAVVTARSPKLRDQVARDLEQGGKRVTVAEWRAVVPDEPMRFYELHNAGRFRPVEVINGSSLPFDTPLPRNVSTVSPNEMRWVTEIQCRDWTAARSPRLPRELLGELRYGLELMRVARSGVAYFCPNIAIWGGESLEGSVVHPVLHPLTVVEQVQAILRPAGWDAEISDKGIYAAQSMDIFGGLDGLVSALRDRERRPLLDAFTAKNGPGNLLSEDGRRYLTWQQFGTVAGRSDPTAALTELIDRGVLSRGIILRCRHCRQSAWHHIAAVGDDFTCRRCRTTQQTARDTWEAKASEPPWSYQLAEVVYQFLKHNGDLPVLAMNDAFADSKRPFMHGFELDVTDPHGECRDVDIFALDGYRLWIGEATVDGEFEAPKIEFVQRLAEATSAYGVLFATSKSTLKPGTQRKITQAFGGSWPRMTQLGGVVRRG